MFTGSSRGDPGTLTGTEVRDPSDVELKTQAVSGADPGAYQRMVAFAEVESLPVRAWSAGAKLARLSSTTGWKVPLTVMVTLWNGRSASTETHRKSCAVPGAYQKMSS